MSVRYPNDYARLLDLCSAPERLSDHVSHLQVQLTKAHCHSQPEALATPYLAGGSAGG